MEEYNIWVQYSKGEPKKAKILDKYYKGSETLYTVQYEDGTVEEDLYQDYVYYSKPKQ